ncbi:hypothetical protein [Acetobacterium tundrae]
MSIKAWCVKNQVLKGSYYYWLKTIREDSLMRASTLVPADIKIPVDQGQS